MITADRRAIEWEPHVLKHEIIETIQGSPIKEVTITKVGHSSNVMSEFFDMLAILLTQPTDLKSLTILQLDGRLSGPLESQVIERLASKTVNLESLALNNSYLEKEFRESFVQLAVKILETSQSLTRFAMMMNRITASQTT